jgi:hypothetical protein
VEHADWVELQCLIKADGSISREDLARAIKRPGFSSEAGARELADQTFQELKDRVDTLGDLPGIYPYKLDSRIDVLSYLPANSRTIQPRLPYLFLMTATRHTMASTRRRRAGIDPTQIFERICAQVLRYCWGGDDRCSVFHVGTACPGGRSNFPATVRALCLKMGEGGSWKKGARSPGAGDGGVDVVVWRAFRDRRQGNLVGFAQCKTGVNWREHIGKLRPVGFCGKFMAEPLIIEPRAFFMVPHRVLHSTWQDRMREGGVILFDRCRIAEYARSLDPVLLADAEAWTRAALKTVKGAIR